MAIRTIMAPGVEIKEIDKSGYTPTIAGTTVYLKGFASKGEAYRPFEITTRTAFEQIYGVPETEAERYFYAGACETLNQNGRLFCARLPYDNESFEKMVGIKYSLTYSKDCALLSNGIFNEVHESDNEIKDAYVIDGGKTPVVYDLADIDAFRTDEAKVPPNTFLVVDTTMGTYGKVTEDFRRGEERECIGIVPVVTTAANALYAQYLVDVQLSNVHNYEVLDVSKLNTLVTDNAKNDGLLSQDVVVPFSTSGMFVPITSDVNMSAYMSELTMGDYATPSAAIAYAQQTLSSQWNQQLSSIDAFYVDGSVYSISATLSLSGVDSLQPPQITKINGIRDTLKLICDAEGQQYPLNSIEDLFFAAAFLSGQIGSATLQATSPEAFVAWKNSVDNEVLSTITISELANAVAQLYVDEFGISGTWSFTFKYLDRCDPYYESTNVPRTQSLDAASFFPTIQPALDGEGFDPEHLKDIGVVVFKMFLDPAEGNKVSYDIVEAFAGSLNKDDKDPNTGVTKFIDTIINSQSKYINFFSNCFATQVDKDRYAEECDILLAPPSVGADLGFFSSMTKKDISVSKSILDGMNKCFDKVSDINKLDIDIVPDAGVANIASYLNAIFGDKGPYDLSITDDLGNSLLGMWTCKKATDDHVKMWKTVLLKNDNFCKNIRKDCMFVADSLRPLVLQGQKKIVRDTKPTNSIDKDILPFIPAICGINTSYGAGYADWFEQADDYSGDFFWCPPSIKATGVYINTDVNYDYWLAPAGLTRGLIAATDVAFSPNGKQAGAFYEKNWNYAINYPQDGIVLEGQKTFQTKPTALDRVNVRRTMLRLERAVYKVIRYFVYESNTAYTRQRVIDAIDPILRACWQAGNGGIARYKIVCDESINTPNVIDNNEMKIQIGIVPNKSADFVLCDFIIGSSGATWAELF